MNNQIFPGVIERINRESHDRMLQETENARRISSISNNRPTVRREKQVSIRLIKAEKEEESEKERDEIASPGPKSMISLLLDAT